MYHGVIFSFGSAKVCSPSIFETRFSYDIWIAATDYYMYLYVLFPLISLLLLINFTASLFLVDSLMLSSCY